MESGTETDQGEVVARAKKRLRRGLAWESTARSRMIEDLRFAAGDPDNRFQWPANVSGLRGNRPCLTMNLVRQHNLQIINKGKQQKAAVTVRPVSGGATKDAADAYEALVQHIQYQSNAQGIFNVAREFQVNGGIGYWRLLTRYSGPDVWEQDIFLAPINDPFSVVLDPDAKERDKSDSNWGFIFDSVPKDEWEERYPEVKDLYGESPLGIGAPRGWIQPDHVMVCEYFEVEQKKDKLVYFLDPESGKRLQLKKSSMPGAMFSAVRKDPLTQVRDIMTRKVRWYLIAGDRVVDETDWAGDKVPIVPLIGEETVLDGVMDRTGHTRHMKDAQRMFNYNASAQVEFVALQSKTPWIAPAEAIEGYEDVWNTSNVRNPAVLPFKHKDDDGEAMQAPQRQEPPTASPAFQSGMDTAFNQLMMVSGQWQNQMGMQGNERTGEAINQRQAQGDTATFHYWDNFELALVNTGKQLITLVPKIYDTERVLHMISPDGSEQELEISPAARVAYAQEMDGAGKIVRRVLNPLIGRYDVVAQPGNALGTQREETVKALTLLLTQAPALTGIIGDLLLASMDFKEAQEAAQRLRRMVPPQALGQGPTQQEQMLQQQVQALQGALAKALQQSGKDAIKLSGRAQLRTTDVYKALTDRLKVLVDARNTATANAAGPEGAPAKVSGKVQADVTAILNQLMTEIQGTSLQAVVDANQDDLDLDSQDMPATDGAPPVPGAKRAPDGEWYLQDPTRVGRYLHVGPLATQHPRSGSVTGG